MPRFAVTSGSSGKLRSALLCSRGWIGPSWATGALDALKGWD